MQVSSIGVRVDRQAPVRLGATPVRTTPEGFKVYSGVATFGDVVLDYPDLQPPRSEFVPADEAMSPEAVASLLHMPFSIEHPPELLDASTAREHVVGSVIRAEADYSQKPPALLVDVIVYDAAAQEDIESGRMCELSPGYRCEEEMLLGSHGGRRYQVVQRRRRYNHLSGVSAARTVTPDGRPARLDEAAGTPAYPHADRAAEARQDRTTMEEQDQTTAPATQAAPASTSGTVRLDALSPEDAEIVKTLSPEGQAVVAAALGGGMASGEESNAGGEESASAGGADMAAVIKQVLATLKDMAMQIAEMKGGSPAPAADAAPPADAQTMADKKDGKKVNASQTFDAEKVIREAREAAAQEVATRLDESARLIGAVRRDGHEGVDTASDAVKVMLTVVGKNLPDLKGLAEESVKQGRLDSLTKYYRQAENIRRESKLNAQGAAVTQALAAPSGDATLQPPQFGETIISFRTPTPRGA